MTTNLSRRNLVWYVVVFVGEGVGRRVDGSIARGMKGGDTTVGAKREKKKQKNKGVIEIRGGPTFGVSFSGL